MSHDEDYSVEKCMYMNCDENVLSSVIVDSKVSKRFVEVS